jgi:hypothetical protein
MSASTKRSRKTGFLGNNLSSRSASALRLVRTAREELMSNRARLFKCVYIPPSEKPWKDFLMCYIFVVT